MDNRYEIAEQNGMSREFADWFFDNKKAGCGNVWFMMMAAMWEGWKGRDAMLQDGGRKPLSTVTAEHRRVIEMLLNVCGAAFELADDSCQQDVDGEECHVIPNDSFEKLSDALDEIENTLPTEDIDRPSVFLAWSAMPRAALKSILQAGNSPVIQDGWVACSERMPEDEQEVITHNIFGYRHISFFDEHSGHFFDRLDGSPVDCVEHVLVSHWMPLPAALQQEVKS